MRSITRHTTARRRIGLLAAALVGALALGAAPAIAGPPAGTTAGTTAGARAADPQVTWLSSDVVPSRTPGVGATAEVSVGSDLNWYDSPPDATFVLRNARGARVDTRTATAECPQRSDCFGDLDDGSEYRWTWNGRRAGGSLLPAGRYVLTATLPDGAGGTITRTVGTTWIRHLATLRSVRRWTPVRQATYARTGRCSSVAVPGRWPDSVGLRSLSRCRSSAGTDDLAAQTMRLVVDGSRVERVVAWRLDAYGAPARAGMTATLWGLTPRGWQRSAVLGNGLRWHNGTTRRTALRSQWLGEDQARRLVVHTQARATGGSRYDVKVLRTVLTYRAWVR